MSNLKTLIAKHDEVLYKLEIFRQERAKEESKWTKTVVNELGQEESIIDYFAWRNHDKESYDKYAVFSENTALEFINWLEMKIDEYTITDIESHLS